MRPALKWDTIENLLSLGAAVGAWFIGERSARTDAMREEADYWRASYDAIRLTLATEREAWQVREAAFVAQLEANAERQVELEAEIAGLQNVEEATS